VNARAPLARAVGVDKTHVLASGPVVALRDVSLQLHAGALVLLMGPSGSGKATLLSLLAGLARPSAGEVEIAGVSLGARSDAELAALRRASIGLVFQSHCLFPALTALDNVAEPLAMKGTPLERVAIARALAGAPPLLFGDEPTASLDGESATAVARLFRAAVTPRRAVMLVTHDERLVRFADRVVRLEDGRITADTEAA
jgi:putative ABC transport system ATP-binding protein